MAAKSYFPYSESNEKQRKNISTSGGDVRNLSLASDLHLSASTLTDTDSGTLQTAPTWSLDGKTIYVQATDKGNQPLLSFPRKSHAIAPAITDGSRPHEQRLRLA